MKQNFLPVLAIFLLTGCGATAQSTQNSASGEPSTLIIDAKGESAAIADRILFQVNIARHHHSAATAFEEHKKLERELVDMITSKELSDDRIQANPIQIQQRRQQNERSVETRQTITIEMDDVARFEEFQVELIEAGFDQFSGSFTSTATEEAREEALKRAFQEARKAGTILAEESGKQLGSVIRIEHTSSPGPVFRSASGFAQMEMYDGGLLRFERSIPVKQHVRVTFTLE